jgi:hypothetical protein
MIAMFRGVGRIIGMLVLMVAGSVGLWYYQDRFGASRQIAKLQEEKRVLQRVVERLTDEKRVADVLVTDQKLIDGVPHTTLLFVEYAKDGTPLPAKSIQIKGNPGHIDAMVIKFDRHFVSEGDPLRGHSIALFTKIYGDREQPSEGHVIDEPGKIPDVYRGADPRVSEFETELWRNFWRLTRDQAYRDSMGVRIANGQGVWERFEPDKLYSITLESDGGLNINSEPLRGIYREALRQRGLPTTAPSHSGG